MEKTHDFTNNLHNVNYSNSGAFTHLLQKDLDQLRTSKSLI